VSLHGAEVWWILLLSLLLLLLAALLLLLLLGEAAGRALQPASLQVNR
jgi:hypothetical protein